MVSCGTPIRPQNYGRLGLLKRKSADVYPSANGRTMWHREPSVSKMGSGTKNCSGVRDGLVYRCCTAGAPNGGWVVNKFALVRGPTTACVRVGNLVIAARCVVAEAVNVAVASIDLGKGVCP